MIFTKGAYQSAKFQENFDCSGEFHQIGTLIGSFCWKYIQFQLKEVQRSYVLWYWRLMQNLKKNHYAVIQNWQEFGEFWSEHYKVSKICTLIAPFRAKYIIFDLKKYRGIIFHDTEESCKILRKTRLWFGKWHQDFGKFSLEHSKI